MRPINVFVKLGGSFITDKAVTDSLKGSRITAAARMLSKAVALAARRGRPIRLVLGHGAGSYGHILAKKYAAVQGVHPKHGWEGLFRIRESMTRMNLEFVRHCNRGGLFPVTVSPFAIARAKDGSLSGIETGCIESLLERGQVALLHGDVVLDSERGFTIASTEALLKALSRHVRFDRIVMVSDTDGVLDSAGATIPRLRHADLGRLGRVVGGSAAPDVTGGMRGKVAELLAILARGGGQARIMRCDGRAENLLNAVLGEGGGGTLIQAEQVRFNAVPCAPRHEVSGRHRPAKRGGRTS